MRIEQPHGYLRDSDGRVVLRFANWSVGTHPVPNDVESVDYVDGASAHSDPVADRYKASKVERDSRR
ncbi:hypothetical protein HRTV-28_gp39 [Halorubrum tailed virus 28]|uniref:Uncharacterized protein n=1 Tax=Halorubrum tailed virus 28 TaxID=2878009 RepID=A0AAE8XZ95_9CAUD|nr:hypothetical protein M1M39_gp40 [Halorubrum tailed virus 28]UBF23477.1 hypothetical protein HRTV-28_gp39 [Halorubrum tailed virus 28]